MKQEEKSIYEFKKGDVITRIKPIIDSDTGHKDYTLIGRKLIFMGIANATIYLAQEFDFLAKILLGMDKNVIQLPVDLWPTGWSYHVEPDFLDEDSMLVDDEQRMQEQLNFAIENQHFEKAEDIRKKLDKLRKKGGKKE
jgi:hypothetical protein